jgi:hypothetical protein
MGPGSTPSAPSQIVWAAGQSVDVLDTVNKWSEAEIIQVISLSLLDLQLFF